MGPEVCMYHIIVNPSSRSGRGRILWKKLEQIIRGRGLAYQVIYTESSIHIAETVRQITSSRPAHSDPEEMIRLIVLGGDGTLNEVISNIADFEHVLVGYIPSGSSNDFARGLHLPADPEIIFRTILEDRVVRKLDIGTVSYENCSNPISRLPNKETGTTHRFDVSAGIGYDAAVCEEALLSRSKNFLNRLGLGKLTYLVLGIKKLAGSRRTACDLILDEDRKIHLDHFLFAAFMIQKYEGGGFKFCPDADETDGILDLCVAGNIRKPAFLAALPFAFRGTHYRFRGIDHYTARKAEIITKEPQWVHTDGEVSVKSDHITVSCEKQILKMLM